MINGFTFNGKHSSQFDLYLNGYTIDPPSKKKIKVEVPGMNSCYDFSTVASGGEIVYDQRKIKIDAYIKGNSNQQLKNKYSIILLYLQDVPESQLVFDEMPDIYFLAEVEDSFDYKEITNNLAQISFEFICEPFKYGVNNTNADIWDTFNFEVDYSGTFSVDVVGSATIIINNPGRVVVPTIYANASMTATIENYTTHLNVGNNVDYGFKLHTGANAITVNGTGHIDFIFKKVIL